MLVFQFMPRTLRIFLLTGVISLFPQAQALPDFLNGKSSSTTSYPSIGSLSGLPKLPSSLSESSPIIPESNVLFEAIVDSLYQLGPSDILTVSMGNRTTNLLVTPEGFVLLENTGPISVGNLTLKQAKNVLAEQLSKNFRSDKIFITLGRAKKIQASVVGAVNNPGIFVVNASARVSDLLMQAGGLTPTANKSFTLSNGKMDTRSFDLDRYFLFQDMTQNPYVHSGDQVRFEEVDAGESSVELRENENVTTLQLKPNVSAYDLIISYNPNKKRRSWTHLQVIAPNGTIKTLTVKESKSHYPANGEVLEIKSYKPLVFVSGAVARPTAYDFNTNYTALDYITSAGVLPNTGKIQNVKIIDSKGKEKMANSSDDKVSPGDHIIVPESKESRVKDYILLFTSVASIILSATLTIVTIYK